MANIASNQCFYSLTLEPSQAINAACIANLIPNTSSSNEQLVEAKGSRLIVSLLERYGPDNDQIKVTPVVEHDCFGIIRGVESVRIPGTTRDQLVVSSDSGRVVILTYNTEKQNFTKEHQETYGKSGVRRTIPGEYLAADAVGRCFMLASTEKNKVVYMLNRDQEGNLQISSPHEANKWQSLTFALAGMDTGWEHPLFAALEVDYSESENDSTGTAYREREKQLVYYQADLGLNVVVRKWADTVDYTANLVFAVPGGKVGPCGAYVCAEDRIYYRHDTQEALCVPIPRRKGATEDPNRKRIIVAGCMHLARSSSSFFHLVQTDDGDVFKLTVHMAKDRQGRVTPNIREIKIKYYDTFPVAQKMLIIRKGFIYIAAENGDSGFFHIDDLADKETDNDDLWSSLEFPSEPTDRYEPVYFWPRPLKYTTLSLNLPSLSPLMRTKVDNLTGEDAPQIYGVSGAGNRSSFKMLKHGLEVEEVVDSPLGNVTYQNLWSLKQRQSDLYHSFLLISSSYAERTIVLEIGDEVETAEDTSFLTNRSTICAAQMGEATLVQVHARGIHMIKPSGEITEWPCPPNRTVVSGDVNQQQVCLGLSSGELAYFQMGDDESLGQLAEMPQMSGTVTAVSMGPTQKGSLRRSVVVVGCDDSTIRVLSLDDKANVSLLQSLSVQALSAPPSTIEVVDMEADNGGGIITYVHIGLTSGLYLRAILDEVTGELSDVRTKFLGAKPTRLFPVPMHEQQTVLACSSRPWLVYSHPQSKTHTTTPLDTPQLEAVSSFVTEHINGVCAIQGSKLLIFSVLNLNGRLVQKSMPLSYTPRGFARNPWYPVTYVVGSDNNTLSIQTKESLRAQVTEVDAPAERVSDGPYDVLAKGQHHWASSIMVVDPVNMTSIQETVLGENEAALSVVVVPFASRGHEVYVAVGTGQNMGQPGARGFVHIYKIDPASDGKTLEFVHKTDFDSPIYALLPFQGRLALGVGNELFIYDIGMSALLRKTRKVVVPNLITSITTQGSRLVCADVSDSVTYVVFKHEHNRLIPFADDTIQRWTTTSSMIDYETTAGGDKFGNLWLARCPEAASKESDEDGQGGFLQNERGYLGGAPHRLDNVMHFFVQDIPMSIQKTALVAGGQEVLFWSGLQGTLGMMVPFVSRDDVDFFSSLEGQLRAEDPPLAGRDHLIYRSYYVPVKGCIDGDLCERFLELSNDLKAKIAAEVDNDVRTIERKIQEMRTRVAF